MALPQLEQEWMLVEKGLVSQSQNALGCPPLSVGLELENQQERDQSFHTSSVELFSERRAARSLSSWSSRSAGSTASSPGCTLSIAHSPQSWYSHHRFHTSVVLVRTLERKPPTIFRLQLPTALLISALLLQRSLVWRGCRGQEILVVEEWSRLSHFLKINYKITK